MSAISREAQCESQFLDVRDFNTLTVVGTSKIEYIEELVERPGLLMPELTI